MRANTPIKKRLVLEALMDYWTRHPHQRLGQLIYNVTAPSAPCPEIFYIEDGELYKLLENEI